MPWRGKVGSVVGSAWRGINYMRYKGPSKRNNNSPKQLDQQAKFRVATAFASTMSDLFKVTYKGYAQQMTARNNAVSVIVRDAIIGTYPAYELDYSKVKISRGKLQTEPSAAMTITASRISWTWTSNRAQNGADENDLATVVVYCPHFNHAAYWLYGLPRMLNAISLDVPQFRGYPVHTWISFIKEDGSRVSDSKYTGTGLIS